MIVDDERLVLRQFALETEDVPGVDVAGAFTNPLEALQFRRENPVDAAFLDIEMPEMSGIVLAEKMREIMPDLVVVFITGYEQYTLDALKIKADYYLTKPYDTKDIREVLERAKLLSARQKKRVYIRTFGRFDVFIDGQAVYFSNTKAKELHAKWWKLRLERQKEIDASIAAKAEFEYLYDRPYVNNKKVRVAGPFTVESLSPHRYIPVDENDNPICEDQSDEGADASKFVNMILETLKVSGIQQAHKEDKINFLSLTPWPGRYICAEGRYEEGKIERRAAIFVGPEFGTVARPDLVSAVREAGDAGFDVVIACAFNFDAASSEFNKLGKIPVLKARMNADLHMAGELKNTGSGNLFVIFGEPDIEIQDVGDNKIQVKLRGVDVFRPQTGEVVSSDPDEIACWFIDTDYNEESFFIRHAYFLGANDPYSALKTSLKADINRDAWESLHSDISRPFEKPESGRIAVKVINHLGDEVLKIFRVK